MSKENWNEQHIKYTITEWINMPTIFSRLAIKFFPEKGKILDVGCGQGQDSRYFAENGYEVIGIDFSSEGIKIAKEKSKFLNIKYIERDISQSLPFADETFDVVYSHLAVHYFNKQKTQSLFLELIRVLKKGGILAVFVNSVNDPEYKTGEKIEDDYYLIRGIKKRFFSSKSLEDFIVGVETIVSNEEGETPKDRAVSTSNLVQYIGRKK